MLLKEMLILLSQSEELSRIRALGLTAAHRCYRLGSKGKLLRAGAGGLRGGLMAVDDRGFDGFGDPSAMVQQLLRECAGHNFGGLVCLFSASSPVLARLIASLDCAAARRGLSLYVPEAYGSQCRHARVMISSALSGGSLRLRLEECSRRFGAPERIALLLEPVAEQFILPAPTGSGRALNRQELDTCIRRHAGDTFFSEELCARYFTYMSGENGGARFVLYDDGITVRKKLLLARQLGISRALGEWDALKDMLPEIIAKA